MTLILLGILVAWLLLTVVLYNRTLDDSVPFEVHYLAKRSYHLMYKHSHNSPVQSWRLEVPKRRDVGVALALMPMGRVFAEQFGDAHCIIRFDTLEDAIKYFAALYDEPVYVPFELATFGLHRDDDESGVSGTGHVANGVVMPSGSVALEWLKEPFGTNIYDDHSHVLFLHGHNGRTRVEMYRGKMGDA